MSTKRRYYRVQPAGLEITSHVSDDSSERDDDENPYEAPARGLHVFEYPLDTLKTDVARGDLEALSTYYGDEVVVIEGGECWDNGDVEGVAIDPETARVVARYSLEKWLRTLAANCSIGQIESGCDERDVDDLLDALTRLARGTIGSV